MSTQPSQIFLTPDQQRFLAELADKTGRPWPEILESALNHCTIPDASTNGSYSLYDAFLESNALGCIDGPMDLSTNPKHMEGFGRLAY
jgi:hypothetical protein